MMPPSSPTAPISKIVTEISNAFDSVSDLYDKNRNFIQSDLAYIEGFDKMSSSLFTSVPFIDEPKFKAHPMYSQMDGIFIKHVQSSIKEIQAEISKNSIPKLRGLIAQIAANKAQFDKKSAKTMDSLKKVILSYAEHRSSIRKPNPDAGLSDYIRSMFTVGQSLQHNYLKMQVAVSEHQAEINRELDSVKAFFSSLHESELEIVSSFSYIISHNFNYFPESSPILTRDTDPSMEIYYKHMQDLLFELRSVGEGPSSEEIEMAPRIWKNPIGDQTFYARVWQNYTPKSDLEVPILKKETVEVVQAPMFSYWKVKRSDGTSGFVPCYILEPIG